MDIRKFNIEECTELDSIIDSFFDVNEFYKIRDIIYNSLLSMDINPNNLIMYYQRYANATSILAIKLLPGNNDDISNYMFNGCQTFYDSSRKVTCDVFLHAEAKVGQLSMRLANMITSHLITFFEILEQDLANNGLEQSEFSFLIPLKDNKKLNSEKEKTGNNRLMKLVKSFFKKDEK